MTPSDGNNRTDRILDTRAQRLADVPQADTPRRLLCQVAVLLVGKTQIGIAVHSLREVRNAVTITPLPGLPEGMLGIAQVRGEVLCILDLSRWIGTEDRGVGGCLAVIEGPRGPLGLVADHCAGFRDIYEDELIADVTGQGALRFRYVHEITRDLCVLLDVPELLNDPRLLVGTPRPASAEVPP